MNLTKQRRKEAMKTKMEIKQCINLLMVSFIVNIKLGWNKSSRTVATEYIALTGGLREMVGHFIAFIYLAGVGYFVINNILA